MTDYRRIPVRLSYGNPEHVKIMDILDDLNLDVHKSRNQFISWWRQKPQTDMCLMIRSIR